MRSTTRRILAAAALAGVSLLAPGRAPADATDTTENGKLGGNGVAAGDSFGSAVDIDGDTLVVGAPFDDDKGDSAGAAYVFVREQDGWTQQAKLTTPNSNPGDLFGLSVAVSGDTIVAGTPGDWGAQPASGSAWVFTRSGATWSVQQRIAASDAGRQDNFGNEVDIDGETIAVGVRDHDGVRGAVYVFTRSGTTWSEQQKLEKASPVSGDAFGGSVSLSGDTLLVGTNEGSVFPHPGGAAYVFTRTGSTWTEQQELRTPATHAQKAFGSSVALHGDRALVTAARPDGGGGADAVFVFERSGGNWSDVQRITPSQAFDESNFGQSLALTDDVLVVGTPGESDLPNNAGSVSVYERADGVWAASRRLVASDAAENDVLSANRSGCAISGRTVIAGASRDDDLGDGSGSAYVFELPPPQPPAVQGFLSIRSARVSGRPGRETLTLSGVLDTGADGADLTLPADFDVGSVFQILPQGLSADRRGRFTFRGDDLFLRITPSRKGTSAAGFYARVSAWPDGRGPLDLRVGLVNADLGVTATVRLDGGRFRFGKTAHVVGPVLALQKLRANVAKPGRHRVSLTARIPTDGSGRAPAEAPALRLFLGNLVYAIDAGDVHAHSRRPYWEHRGARGVSGVSLFRVDYGRGLVTVQLRDVDLGEVPSGPVRLLVGIGVGSELHAVEVTALRRRSALKY